MESKGIKNEFIKPEVYHNLPSILEEVTDNFSGREKDIVLLSSLSVLSACLPNISGNYDGDEVYPNLFSLIIAPPASGKGVMNYSRILIQDIHNKIFKESRYALNSCEENKRKSKEKEFADCPKLKVKIIPANISSAEMYSYIDSAEDGVLIIESEADTMSNMLNNDWSNYSDVLRKAFHHEPISISRKIDNTFLDIEEPKLSIVMSGTPNQLQPLIKSKDNGLFSRFAIYSFDEIAGFKDVFSPSSKDYKASFEKVSKEVYMLYESLLSFDDKVRFELTSNQKKRVIKEFSEIHSTVLEHHPNSFLSNLNRHGLILFRVCMILTAIRQKEFSNILICSNRDFLIGLKIVLSLLKHALLVHNTIEDGVLSKSDEEFLFGLGIRFSRKQAVDLGEKLKIPQRTVDDKLVQWRKKKAIIKVNHGQFKRILK